MSRVVGVVRRAIWACLMLLQVCLCGSVAARADDDGPDFLAVAPDAEALGPSEGTPAAQPAYRHGKLAGYVFTSRGVVASAGYSGKPLDLLIGIDLDARITGVRILEQHEPILVIGVSEENLQRFVDQYVGRDLRDPIVVTTDTPPGPGEVDAVSGATISSIVLNDIVLNAGRAVARSRGLMGDSGIALDFESYAPLSWLELIADGSLVVHRLSVDEAENLFDARGGRLFAPGAAPSDREATFVELFVGLATPARVGRNLLGGREYNAAMADLAPGDQLVFVGGSGLYSFKGTAWVRDGIFDRIQIVQGERTFRLTKADHLRVEALAAEKAPGLREAALFRIPAALGFEPAQPWRLDLFLSANSDTSMPFMIAVPVAYHLPAVYHRAPIIAQGGGEPVPLWQGIWEQRIGEIAVLCAALLVLTAILVFQDEIAARRRLYLRVRLGFLVFTLVWLGWIVGAQLSVLNVLTFAQALRAEFHWELFLLEPLIFILWGYVALALLFWGRGVFCGWLCPFGAMQELTNKLAQKLHVPQRRLPFGLHERLWPLKYVVFASLFALSLGKMDLAQRGAEVEPFKTAVILHFDRGWPFVAYALLLLGAGLFVERFFCRYLCPLGAALALPARLRMFDWLKRRWQCGLQCQICANRCPVQAIHPDGRINPNECIHCLNCQVLYYDDTTCPPLAERRKRKESKLTQRLVARFEAAEKAGEESAGGGRSDD